MTKRVDYSEKRFGKLTVVNDIRIDSKVLCKCDCGNEKYISINSLRTGNTSSCGCFRREFLSEVGKKKTHGLTNTRLYNSWRGMISRCYSENYQYSKHYKDKGITVCDEWRYNKQSFFDWAMQNGYSDGLTIDRIDNSKGYYPENCRFSDIYTQNNNKTNSVRIDGMTVKILAEKHGINESTMWSRVWREKNKNVQTQR